MLPLVQESELPKLRAMIAPIDEKNVCTDWIEDVFDDNNCIWGKKSAVGYFKGEPVVVTWEGNVLYWRFPIISHLENSITLAYLKEKLCEWHDKESNLVDYFNVIGDTLTQSFYFKED